MEILPVNDLDVALHEFVNKDDKQAFYACVQHNLEETRVCILMQFSANIGQPYSTRSSFHAYSIFYSG
jgi:hypothetical protein